MADVRELFTQHFDAARAASSQEDQAAAAESLRAAVLVARSDPSLQRELASALLHLGKLTEKLGRKGEAEELLTEALGISERLFGMEHPSLGPLLNELSRLHIQQSHHARAEAALERLLGIARAKGEEHAEVATALAGLAFVKRRTGDDAAAEALYRDALSIRQKVLAPDHMVTVVTLEQLSETCAARGKAGEALSLLKRALPTREAALGADHPTVTATRTRISALELQVAPAPAAGDPNELVFLYKPEAKKRRPPPPPRGLTPPLSQLAALAAVPPKAPPAPKAPPVPRAPQAPKPAPAPAALAAPVVVAARESAPVVASVPGRTSSAVHRDVVRAAELAAGDVVPAAAHATKPSSGKRTMLLASAGVAAVAIAAVGLTLRSSGGDSVRVATAASAAAPAPVITLAATKSSPARNDAAPTVDAGRVELQGSVKAPPAPGHASDPITSTPSARTEQHAVASAPAPVEPSVPSVRLDLGRVGVPTASVNVDSIVRSSTKLERESRTDQLGAGMSRAARIEKSTPSAKSVDADEPVASRPTIIGRAPVPRFPESLRSTLPEGEVVVRFEVDEHGRVNVGSMTVVKSDHDLFTAAVRNILPLYRFEPAHLPDSKPVAIWVELPIRFSAKR